MRSDTNGPGAASELDPAEFEVFLRENPPAPDPKEGEAPAQPLPKEEAPAPAAEEPERPKDPEEPEVPEEAKDPEEPEEAGKAADDPAIEAPPEVPEGETQPEAPVQTTVETAPARTAEEIAELLKNHYLRLRELIRAFKAKDEALAKLNDTANRCREGYAEKSFRPIAQLIIPFRENCRKSLEDSFSYRVDAQAAKKYMRYLTEDLEDILFDAGVCEEEGVLYFNGRQIAGNTKPPVRNAFAEEPASAAAPGPIDPPQGDFSDLAAYLAHVEDDVRALLANEETLLSGFCRAASAASAAEDDLLVLSVVPAIRKLWTLKKKCAALSQAASENDDEEEALHSYRDLLRFLMEGCERTLSLGGVTVETPSEDRFDPARDRLLLAVETNDPALERVVAKRYTDRYLLGTTILFPCKVDVYRYVEKK